MKACLALVLIMVTPIFGFAADVEKNEGTGKMTQPLPVTATRDAATISINGEPVDFSGLAMLIGTRGSSTLGFRARALVACDQHSSRDVKKAGEYGLAGAAGKAVHVCSFSISNGSVAQDVQFVSGTEACSGSGCTCNGNPVSAKFHLAPYQFITQGSGVGVVFTTGGGSPLNGGLCLKVYGAGDVGVNVSFATH